MNVATFKYELKPQKSAGFESKVVQFVFEKLQKPLLKLLIRIWKCVNTVN